MKTFGALLVFIQIMLVQKLILFNWTIFKIKFSNLKNKKVVGLGETGLDFFRGKNRINQIESFMLHLFYQEKRYPTIVHTRDADDDTINCLTNL